MCFQLDAGKIQKGEGGKERNCSFRRKYLSISKTEKAQRRRVTTIFTSFALSAPKANAESMQTESTLGEGSVTAAGAQLNCEHSNKSIGDCGKQGDLADRTAFTYDV